MASWQAWLFDGVLRWTLKRHGDKPIDLAQVRARTNHPPRSALIVPKGFRVDELRTEEGLSFDVADRAGRPADAPATAVLYLHGGGYFFGSPKTHRQIIIAMAKVFGGPCYGLDYRLAPEHPFPAAVEDAHHAYQWIAEQHPEARIVLAGDSAGGGLAIVTAMHVRDAGLRAPAAIVAFSPWTDLAVTGPSVWSNERRCAMFTPKGLQQGASIYLGGADPRDPRASPLYGDLSRLPPMLLFASRHELLLDDTMRLAERARASGVEVDLVLRDSLPHVWPVFLRLLPEGREAIQSVALFARQIALQRKRELDGFAA
jgi:acetyl esterase/lipase